MNQAGYIGKWVYASSRIDCDINTVFVPDKSDL